MELAPAPLVHLAVHADAFGEDGLDVAPTPREIGEFEQLSEADHVAGDGYVAHGGDDTPRRR